MHAGTTGDIEAAHKRLDALGVPDGTLAERVMRITSAPPLSWGAFHAVRIGHRLQSGVIVWDST